MRILNIKAAIQDQFSELNKTGLMIVQDQATPNYLEEVNHGAFVKWRTQVVTLLDRVLPPHSPLRKNLQRYLEYSNYSEEANEVLGTLLACKDDFDAGLLDDLEMRVAASISVDYMEQAEALISESRTCDNTHIPAAVLAGAMLEKSMRTLCQKQNPPIADTTSGGKKKTLNPLIDDLKAANVFNEIYAKQLRAWADIRNAAAHGRFEEFTKEQVGAMIAGINQFLLDYMQIRLVRMLECDREGAVGLHE